MSEETIQQRLAELEPMAQELQRFRAQLMSHLLIPAEKGAEYKSEASPYPRTEHGQAPTPTGLPIGMGASFYHASRWRLPPPKGGRGVYSPPKGGWGGRAFTTPRPRCRYLLGPLRRVREECRRQS